MGCVRPQWECPGKHTGANSSVHAQSGVRSSFSYPLGEGPLGQRERCEPKHSGKKIQSTSEKDIEPKVTQDKGLKMLGEEIDISLETP